MKKIHQPIFRFSNNPTKGVLADSTLDLGFLQGHLIFLMFFITAALQSSGLSVLALLHLQHEVQIVLPLIRKWRQ